MFLEHARKWRGGQIGFFLAVLGLTVSAPSARADLIYTLTRDGCTGGCGTSPFGKVDLLGLNPDTVQITVTLFNADKFVSTGVSHEAFAFNISGTVATIGTLPAGFQAGPHNVGETPFGTFGYSVVCPGCGPGASHAKPGPLTFDVTRATGLSVSSFVKDSKGFLFAADIIGNNGGTGNVAAVVPEPRLYGLLLMALVSGIALAGKRRSA